MRNSPLKRSGTVQHVLTRDHTQFYLPDTAFPQNFFSVYNGVPWRIFSDTTIGPLLNFFKTSALALNSTFEFQRVERRPIYHQCREATTRTPRPCFHKLAACSLISRTSSGQSGWTGPPASTLWRRPRAGQDYLYIEWSDATVTIRSLCCAATRRTV